MTTHAMPKYLMTERTSRARLSRWRRTILGLITLLIGFPAESPQFVDQAHSATTAQPASTAILPAQDTIVAAAGTVVNVSSTKTVVRATDTRGHLLHFSRTRSSGGFSLTSLNARSAR